MEFLLQQQANFEAREAAAKARFDAEMAKIQATLDTMAGSEAQHDREIKQIRDELRRAVRLSVQEARAERKRRKDADAKLAESQAALEASLKAFIDSMRKGHNGHDKN